MTQELSSDPTGGAIASGIEKLLHQHREQLVEALRLNIEERRKHGLTVDRDEYRSKFPQLLQIIKLAFSTHENTADSTCDTGEGSLPTTLPWSTVSPVRSPAGVAVGTRFRALKKHARGGLGEVYVAADDELDREVALKEIRDRYADDPNAQARSIQEAEITGRLEHPGTVRPGRIPRPREVDATVPVGLDAVCRRAMALAPSERYQSARELADDLEHWLADEPIAPRPDRCRDRASRWMHRHRAWTQAGTAIRGRRYVGREIHVNI
jgi:hypothetical protein